MGAKFLWAGQWKRVEHYGDIEREYRAVREGVGLIDVGTLGKFLVTGPDAVPFLERLYPNRVGDIQPGRLRYGLLLDEHGVIHDDGTICRLDEERFYLTVTTSGAEEAEAWMLDWRDAWEMDVHVVNQTSALGADQRGRAEGARRARDADRGRHLARGLPVPAPAARSRSRASRASRSGSASWARSAGSCTTRPRARASSGRRCCRPAQQHGIVPFGIQAQRLLRLEKGHIIVSQDTDFETTPWRVDMGWAVKLEKD